MAHLNFTIEDWQRVERDTCAWWEGELGRPLVYLSVFHPVAGAIHPLGPLGVCPDDSSAGDVGGRAAVPRCVCL